MTNFRYLWLKGLPRPALFDRAAGLEADIARMLPGWPLSWGEVQTAAVPFATLRPGGRRDWSIMLEGREPREWDAVDALCDLVAELAWERIRCRPQLLSLHAGSVEFDGGLVVFPDIKRAGKSTLSVAMARLGRRLYTDDVLPVDIDGDGGVMMGLGSGIAPRLRLPLPADFSEDFRAWVRDDHGPGNDRYKYITGIDVAPLGASCPLGAVVLVDRDDTAARPELSETRRSDAMARIIHQNFARDQHSARILAAAEAMTRDLPIFTLRYASAEDAAACLDEHPRLRDLLTARVGGIGTATGWQRDTPPEFDPGAVHARAEGVAMTETEGEMFLTDPNGAAIHRLNPGSALVWQALDEPGATKEIAGAIAEIFPEEDPDRIAADTERTLRELTRARLVVPRG